MTENGWPTIVQNANRHKVFYRKALTENLESQLAGFTGHVRISDFDSISFRKVPDRPGVYVIRAVRRTGRPIHLRRLNGTDVGGILCIGMSKDVRRRIRDFVRDVRRPGLDVPSHSEGWNFRRYFRDNQKRGIIKLTQENLEATWKVTGTNRYAQNLETQLLQAYVMKYQDKPPLNISIKRE